MSLWRVLRVTRVFLNAFGRISGTQTVAARPAHAFPATWQPYCLSRPLAAATSLALAGAIREVANSKDQALTDRLLRAARQGDVRGIRSLVAKGVDVNGQHSLGWSPLHVAAVCGQAEAVQALIEAGADPDVAEEFTDIYRTARTKGMHSMDVMMEREREFW